MTSHEQSPSVVEHHGHETPRPKNPFAAIGLFLRQIFDELRKVVVPTRRELITYSVTVLLFVAFMILFIFGLDALFGWLSNILFVRPDGV